ncbi:MAG: hypothetical protein ABIP13_03335, partial [Tepidiformaceae bacterium]
WRSHAGVLPDRAELRRLSGDHRSGPGAAVVQRQGHTPPAGGDHFFALSDRYTVDAPFYGKNIYSLGDFVLFAGGAVAILQGVAGLPPKRKRTAAVAGGAQIGSDGPIAP